MTLDEYNQKLKDTEARHKVEIREIQKEYAFSNNNVKIGDVITNKCGDTTIVVEKVQLTVFLREPECVYSGKRLRKDGMPYKNGEVEYIHQSNLKESTK